MGCFELSLAGISFVGLKWPWSYVLGWSTQGWARPGCVRVGYIHVSCDSLRWDGVGGARLSWTRLGSAWLNSAALVCDGPGLAQLEIYFAPFEWPEIDSAGLVAGLCCAGLGSFKETSQENL